jgi:hypothetical protein
MEKVTIKDFPELNLGDVRRDQRFVTIIDNIVRQPACSIPQQNNGWYETKAAYEFFKNEEVTPEVLQKIIASYGVAQIGEGSQILVMHDMTNISFNGSGVEGLGYLDHAKGNGIMCYNSIAVSTDGLPLALLYQHTWTRPWENVGKAKNKKKTPFEDKESYEWYKGITNVNNSLGKSIHKIHIADRQADVYELFFSAYEEQTDLLIRAYCNRKLANGNHLWDHVSQLEPSAQITLEINDPGGKKKKNIEASIRYQEVEILRPSTSNNQYESIKLMAIEVMEQGLIANEEERVLWRLLTTVKVESTSDVLKCVKWYTQRWLIERFHFTLKSGTKIEALQLKQAKSLQKAISVYSLAGFKIMQLVYLSRVHPDINREVILTNEQWVVLYMLIHKSHEIPNEPPSLKEVVAWIGRLGGHLGRKSDGPPGLKAVWQGYKRLCDATELFEITRIKNLGKE